MANNTVLLEKEIFEIHPFEEAEQEEWNVMLQLLEEQWEK